MKRTLLLCLAIGCRPAPAPPAEPDRAALLQDLRREAAGQTRDFERVLALISDRVEEHFRIRLARVDDVGAELFSAKGKWRAVFWSDADYERSVRRLFDRRIFAGMPALLDSIAKDLEAAAEASDHRLMAAVEGHVRASLPDLDFEEFRRDYVTGLAASAVRDAGVNVLSLAAGDVAAAVVSSSLVLALGAAGSWWTLGASLAAAVIATVMIEAIWGDEIESAARWRIRGKVLEFRIEAMRKIGDAVDRAVIRYLSSREEAIVHAINMHPAS